jgi:hypothetical protein
MACEWRTELGNGGHEGEVVSSLIGKPHLLLVCMGIALEIFHIEF